MSHHQKSVVGAISVLPPSISLVGEASRHPDVACRLDVQLGYELRVYGVHWGEQGNAGFEMGLDVGFVVFAVVSCYWFAASREIVNWAAQHWVIPPGPVQLPAG